MTIILKESMEWQIQRRKHLLISKIKNRKLPSHPEDRV